MGLRGFFSILVLTVSSAAFAKPLDGVIIKDHSAQALSVEDEGLIDLFRQKLDEAQLISVDLPEQGSHLKVIDMNSNIKSQYYKERISIQTACPVGIRLPSTEYLPVLLHEYGHTVFEINLEHFLLKEKTESEHYEDKFDDGEKTFNYNVPIGIVDLAAPYNEYFADVYAVMTLRNPTAMSDYFLACNGLEHHRDFTWNYTVDPQHPVSDLTAIFTDVHLTLDPSRTYIWKRYQQMGGRAEARAQIINAVFMASQSAIADDYHGGALYKDWAHMDVEKMNADFIKRIERYLPQ